MRTGKLYGKKKYESQFHVKWGNQKEKIKKKKLTWVCLNQHTKSIT
jgi:hypothetical protein